MLGDLFPVWSYETRSHDELAYVSYFLELYSGLIVGLLYEAFDLELWELSVVDYVHNSILSLGFCCAYNTRMVVLCFDIDFSCCLNLFRSSLAL